MVKHLMEELSSSIWERYSRGIIRTVGSNTSRIQSVATISRSSPSRHVEAR